MQNLVPAELYNEMQREPWIKITSGSPPSSVGRFYVKCVCHTVQGCGFAATDLVDAWAAHVSVESLTSLVQRTIPGVTLESTEVLRIVENCVKKRDGCSCAAARAQKGELTMKFLCNLELGIGHELPVSFDVRCSHVSSLVSDERRKRTAAAEFIRDLVVSPLLAMVHTMDAALSLSQIPSSLVVTHKLVPAGDAGEAAHRAGAAPCDLEVGKCWGYNEIMAQHFVPSSTAHHVGVPAPTPTATTATTRFEDVMAGSELLAFTGKRGGGESQYNKPPSAQNIDKEKPMARRVSSYVESPEEQSRKRKLEEQIKAKDYRGAAAAPTAKGVAKSEERLKKIRKVLL